MSNVVSLFGNINDEDGEFNQFLEDLKNNKVKGAFIVLDNKGELNVSFNSLVKAEQIVILYKLKRVIEDLVNYYSPDDFENENEDD
jgi:hypothetical protein